MLFHLVIELMKSRVEITQLQIKYLNPKYWLTHREPTFHNYISQVQVKL